MTTKILAIAALAHAINVGYSASLGDLNHKPWAETPPDIQASVVAGVEMHLANPNTTPEQSHEAWLAHKASEGWSYGEAKDFEKKTHPCFLPYADLPAEQKSKDYIFRAAVHAAAAVFDEVYAEATAAASHAAAEPITDTITKVVVREVVLGKTPVKYIGTTTPYTDGMFGTHIQFVHGESQLVPDAIAAQMFKHAGVYVPGDSREAEEPVIPQRPDGTDTESDLQDLRDQVALMDKPALISLAKTNYRVDLSKNATLEHIRAKVVGFIDQYGVA